MKIFKTFMFLIMTNLIADEMMKIPNLPNPVYKVRLQKSQMIPMRDDIRLSTDLYFPEIIEKKLPVILIRTPYNKNTFRNKEEKLVAHFFSSQGYIVAVQDCRGKFESEGVYSPPAGNEANDGYDTVDWLTKQTWSNGKIGTFGCSYPGEMQMVQAPLMHPGLAAMIPQAAGGVIGAANGRYNYWAGFKGGVLDHAASISWYFRAAHKYSYKPPSGLTDTEILKIREFFNPAATLLPDVDFEKLNWYLPLIDIMNKAGAPPNDWVNLITTDFGDPWWHEVMSFYDGDEKFNTPAIHMSSWYDFSVEETLFAAKYFSDNAVTKTVAENQFVIIAPTGHCDFDQSGENTKVGELYIGDATFDYFGTYLKWFDYWLKGQKNSVTDMPKVQYFTIGKNEWQSADEWPLPETKFTKYYLHSGGNANSRYGDGILSQKPSENEFSDKYTYDPGNPVPTIGGSRSEPAGAFDQAKVEIRNDVLVYSTPVLKKGIEITGPITLILFVSSSARDTDFTAKLIDVYPDGKAYNIQDAIFRARYREGLTKKVWMERDKVYKIQINLNAASNYFASGHIIRLQVSSSNFPMYERNLNTGGNNYDETEWVLAENTIHHSKEYPSHLILPIIEN